MRDDRECYFFVYLWWENKTILFESPLMNLACSIYQSNSHHLHSQTVFSDTLRTKYELLGWSESTPLVVPVEDLKFRNDLHISIPVARSSSLGSDSSHQWWLGLDSLVIASSSVTARSPRVLASLLLQITGSLSITRWARHDIRHDQSCAPNCRGKKIILSGELCKTQHELEQYTFYWLLMEYLLFSTLWIYPFALFYPLDLH